MDRGHAYKKEHLGAFLNVMHNGNNIWELPFGLPAELELQTEWGNLSLVPVEPGQRPRLELSPGSADNIAVHVDKQGDAVRVSLDPQRSFKWLAGGWECRATLYVPRDVRAHLQTNAGSVSVRDLNGCELGIKVPLLGGDGWDSPTLFQAAGGALEGCYFSNHYSPEEKRVRLTALSPIRRDLIAHPLRQLARGLDVCIETHTSLGSVRNRYPSRPTAATKLLLSTEMGSVRVDEGSSFGPGRRPSAASAPTAPSWPQVPSAPAREDPELERILKMVEAGELSAQDADELLRALGRV